jgi:hypothetical protein
MVERNTCDAVMRGIVVPPGGHITRKRIASETGISRDWPSVSSERDGPHREGEEPYDFAIRLGNCRGRFVYDP